MILLLTNIMSWKNIVAETTAWDTMFWFAVLVMMANALNKYGAIIWISTHISASVGGFSWPVAFTILVLVCSIPAISLLQPWRIFPQMYLAFGQRLSLWVHHQSLLQLV